MLQTIGWVGTTLFILGGYFLGSKSVLTRINSVLTFSLANFCFVIQGYAMSNWPLVTISIVAVFLNLRVAYRWANGET